MKRVNLRRGSSTLRRVAMRRASKIKAARRSRESFKWSREVLERDGRRCQWPGGCFTGNTIIDPHHIAERSLRPDLKYELSNGIALCRQHHNWLPLHRAEAIEMGLLSDETYERAMKEKAA